MSPAGAQMPVSSGFIDNARVPVNVRDMEPDELLPRRSDDPLAVLARQDLDPLSVTELHARIAALEAEIARTQAKAAKAVNHRASADALFRQ